MELEILHQILNKLETLDKLDAKIDKLTARVSDLTELVHGIHAHQEADFVLLSAIDEKVTRLANVSEDHEQRLQRLGSL